MFLIYWDLQITYTFFFFLQKRSLHVIAQQNIFDATAFLTLSVTLCSGTHL